MQAHRRPISESGAIFWFFGLFAICKQELYGKMLVWNITIKETKPMKINRWKQSYKNLKLAQKMLLIYLVLLGVCLVLCLDRAAGEL